MCRRRRLLRRFCRWRFFLFYRGCRADGLFGRLLGCDSVSDSDSDTVSVSAWVADSVTVSVTDSVSTGTTEICFARRCRTANTVATVHTVTKITLAVRIAHTFFGIFRKYIRNAFPRFISQSPDLLQGRNQRTAKRVNFRERIFLYSRTDGYRFRQYRHILHRF